MEAWRDIILLASVLGIFAFGFFLTTRLDKLLDANRKADEKKSLSRLLFRFVFFRPSFLKLSSDSLHG